jgi:ribonuclease HII
MIVVGIDENGLGPVLGPMIVTATAFRTPLYSEDVFWQLSDAELPADDSKIVFKSRKKAVAETAVLQWMQLLRTHPQTAETLYRGIDPTTRSPCPFELPFGCRLPDSLPIPCFGGRDSALTSQIRERFSTAAIEPLCCTAVISCPGHFNETVSPLGRNKLQFDFDMMLQLVDRIRIRFPDEFILALCGKIGGTRCYLPWFESSGKVNVVIRQEERNESRYQLGEDTEIRFIKDGDSLHLPVAVASMIGKYLRELQMAELNQLLAPDAPPVSGYRDPRTKQFIHDTGKRRQQLALPARCFLRNC